MVSKKYYLWAAAVVASITLNAANYRWILVNYSNTSTTLELSLWQLISGVTFIVLILASIIYGIRSAILRKPKWGISMLVPIVIFGMHFLPWVQYWIAFFHPEMEAWDINFN